MKTVVFTHQTQKMLSANGLDCRAMDNFEQFVASLEHISRTSAKHFEILAIQVDVLQIVFDLEIDSERVLVSQVRMVGDCC